MKLVGLILGLAALSAVACDDADSPDVTLPATGGTSGTGGTTAEGGSLNEGGMPSTGGMVQGTGGATETADFACSEPSSTTACCDECLARCCSYENDECSASPDYTENGTPDCTEELAAVFVCLDEKTAQAGWAFSPSEAVQCLNEVAVDPAAGPDWRTDELIDCAVGQTAFECHCTTACFGHL